jgi:hypothetical protein
MLPRDEIFSVAVVVSDAEQVIEKRACPTAGTIKENF